MSSVPSAVVAAGKPLDHVLFEYLADRDGSLATYINPRTKSIDFDDAEAVRCLSRSILKHYFDLNVILHPERLCPMIPSRWEYARWIQEIVESTSNTYLPDGSANPRGRVIGLDIGTGSSAIYALLIAQTRPKWSVVGTDIDLESLSNANENIRLNSLELQVSILRQTPSDPLFPISKFKDNHFAFTMCNPPFYTSKADIEASANAKAKAALTVCTGAEVEMITNGGELAFAARMLDESKDPAVHCKIDWFSSLFGKLENAVEIASRLKNCGIDNFTTTKIEVGKHTRRWAVAWSFQNKRPSDAFASKRPDFANKLGFVSTETTIPFKPQPGSLRSPHTLESNVDFFIDRVKSQVMGEGYWNWDVESHSGLLVTIGHPWTRAERRRRAREALASDAAKNTVKEQNSTEAQDNQTTTSQQVFAVCLKFHSTQPDSAEEDQSSGNTDEQSAQFKVHARWLQGPSIKGWESFMTKVRSIGNQIARETSN